MIAKVLIALALLLSVFASTANAELKVLLNCPVDQTARSADPIKGFGFEPFGHPHTNFGSTAFSPTMTVPQMMQAPTTCALKSDHSSGWFPTPLKPDGTPATVRSVKYYLRGSADTRGTDVEATGVKLVMGDPACQGAYCEGQFSCISKTNVRITNSHTVPTAAQCNAANGASYIQFTLNSSACWDGIRSGPGMGASDGPADAQSHFGPQFCSTGLRVPFLALTVFTELDFAGGKLSCDKAGTVNPGECAHADYVFGFIRGSDGTLALPKIIDQCFNSAEARAVPGGQQSCALNSSGQVVQNYGTRSIVTD